MATRKSTRTKSSNSTSPHFASLAEWKAHFLPEGKFSEPTNAKREDPEQLAIRLVKETLASLRPKAGI